MTIQTKDNIIIKGEKFDLYTYPLDSYWSKKNPKPGIRIPETSCWRGYIATWEIIDEYLYLTDIQYFAPDEDQGLDYVFPNNSGKVKATWFTGELKLPIGDELTSQVMWDTVYETDWFIEINEGKIVSQRYKANY
jgi:hypothetical protein